MDWTHRLRIRQLEVLRSLALTQNISHSAAQLNMTQPALSKWLKELEADLGLVLFERHARGLRPTAHGRTLIASAQRIVVELDRARDEMAALRSGSAGRALIGGSGATIASVVPQAVLGVLAAMPNASIEVLEGPMDRLFEQLRQREIDVAVGRASPKYHDPAIDSELLYADRLQFAVRPEHPLAARAALQWAELVAYPWVVWSRDIPVRDLLEGAVAAAGWALPRGSVQSNSLLATLALVTGSDMVAAVSERAIGLPVRSGTLLALPFSLETHSVVTMYWRRDVAGSAAVAALLDALRKVRHEKPRVSAH